MPHPRLIAALILAGGQARRLDGVDKTLLSVGGRTILSRIVDALAGEAAQCAISANGDPARFAAFGLPVLADGPLAGNGPLGGLFVGLGWAAGVGAGALLTVTGDAPFLPAGLAASLSPAPGWAQGPARLHPLIALWPVDAREKLRLFLTREPRRRVRDFGAAIGMRPVAFADERAFFNVNTHADWAAAKRGVTKEDDCNA